MTPVTAETAEQAEAAFYTAFENGDPEAMAQIWSSSEDVVCVHPGGPQLLGHDAVMQSWRNILAQTGGLRVSVQVVHVYTDRDTAVRFVNETLFNDDDPDRPVTVLATNAYRRTESGWHIVLHHASPVPGELEDAADDHARDTDISVTLH